MNILIDTNVIMDFFEEREPFVDAAQRVLVKCAEAKCTGLVCSSSVTDIYYLLQKRYGKAKALEQIQTLLETLTGTDVGHVDLRKAIESGMPDFEDAVVAHSAKRAKASYIVTRNLVDFDDSPVPAISPDNFNELDIDG